MIFFEINHPSRGVRKDCLADRCTTAAIQINLALVTEVEWEEGLWVVRIGPDHYRVHGEEKMKALEKALTITRP